MVMDLNIQRLGPLIDEIAANLSASQALLNDNRHFPVQPRTPDEKRLLEIQEQLRAIAERQNEALNVLSGTYYSYNGNRLMGHGDGMAKGDGTGVPVDDPNHETPIVLPPIRTVQASPDPNEPEPPSPNSTPASVDIGLPGETAFARLFNRLTAYQLDEQPLEAEAGKTIVETAEHCR